MFALYRYRCLHCTGIGVCVCVCVCVWFRLTSRLHVDSKLQVLKQWWLTLIRKSHICKKNFFEKCMTYLT